jgi:hypothetical protein
LDIGLRDSSISATTHEAVALDAIPPLINKVFPLDLTLPFSEDLTGGFAGNAVYVHE